MVLFKPLLIAAIGMTTALGLQSETLVGALGLAGSQNGSAGAPAVAGPGAPSDAAAFEPTGGSFFEAEIITSQSLAGLVSMDRHALDVAAAQQLTAAASAPGGTNSPAAGSGSGGEGSSRTGDTASGDTGGDNPGDPAVPAADGSETHLEELAQGGAPLTFQLANLCTSDGDGDGICDGDDRCPRTPAGEAVLSSGCHLQAEIALVLDGIRFAFDSDRVTSASAEELIRAIRLLRSHPDVSVVIAGHTDSLGGDDYNERLSQRRAEAVYRLIAPHIPAPERLTTKGFGRSQPVAANMLPGGVDNPYGRAKNRRVEFRLEPGSETTWASR